MEETHTQTHTHARTGNICCKASNAYGTIAMTESHRYCHHQNTKLPWACMPALSLCSMCCVDHLSAGSKKQNKTNKKTRRREPRHHHFRLAPPPSLGGQQKQNKTKKHAAPNRVTINIGLPPPPVSLSWVNSPRT